MARKTRGNGAAIAVRPEKWVAADARLALPPNERKLNFGDRWSYAPAPEAHNYIQFKSRYQLFINGKFVAPHSGRYFPSINPATEEQLAEIAEGDAHDVDLG
ncbi:MAG TPA: hypothetical protein VG095_05425 [Chthoniobacterales bacterium]|nr:hypothetical protein [Chthoniobacterales bacterium]